jgi:Hemerythrin HHE cation binding domain
MSMLVGAFTDRIPNALNSDLPWRAPAMKFEIPEPLKREHDALHAILRRATTEPGALGESAKAVARLMHPHFAKEEAFALPPLGLLDALAHGSVTPGMKGVLEMTDRLKIELADMLAEHQTIVGALEALIHAAQQAHRPEYAEFALQLIEHARTEELVHYPAAILVGEYVKEKLHLVQL